MCVPDRLTKRERELAALEYDFLVMHGLDRAERDGEIARVLDIDDEFLATLGHLPDGADRLVPVMHEDVEAFRNWFFHDRRLLSNARDSIPIHGKGAGPSACALET